MSHVNIQFMEKVAALDAQGVRPEQIAEVMGVEIQTVNGLRNEPSYQEVFDKVKLGTLVKDKKFDDSWDGVEERALDIISKNLKYNLDPNFAIKAATLANRAIRRGSPRNNPLDANQGPKAIITLNTIFIGKLQAPPQMSDVKVVEHRNTMLEDGTNKVVDLLNPSEVEQLLNPAVAKPRHMVTDIEFGD